MAKSRRVRAHRQSHLDQRQAHPEVRRQDVSPQDPVHRCAQPQRRVHLQRRHDAAPGHLGRHRGFPSLISCSGIPRKVTRSNPATWWGGTGTYWHGFFQDDYRSTNNLTVNLGLRYEYTPWLTGYRNQAAAFDPTRAKSIIVSSESDQIDLARRRWPTSDISCSAISSRQAARPACRFS